MLKSVERIYKQGEIKLLENVNNIPQDTKVIVTFLINSQDSQVVNNNSILNHVLSNEEIDRILIFYCQENKPRFSSLSKGLFKVPDDFNEPLPSEILDLFNS